MAARDPSRWTVRREKKRMEATMTDETLLQLVPDFHRDAIQNAIDGSKVEENNAPMNEGTVTSNNQANLELSFLFISLMKLCMT